jgi:hypothetical protein
VHTPGFCLAQVGADFPCADADHAEALGLVECADFLFGFAECHAIRQLSEFGLRVRLLGLAGTTFRLC